MGLKNTFINSSDLVLVTIALGTFLIVLPSINFHYYYNSTITSKTVFFSYGLLIVFGFLIVQRLFSKRAVFQIKIVQVDITLFILFIYILANRYFFQTDHGFSIRFIELLGLSFLYSLLRFVPKHFYPWLSLAIIGSGSIQAIYGGLQILGYISSLHPGFKITGSFFNPGPYAGFLASVFALSLGVYLYREDILSFSLSPNSQKTPFGYKLTSFVYEYIPLVGLVSTAAILPATHSRAAILAAAGSGSVLLASRYRVFKRFKNIPTIKKSFLLCLSTLILFVTSIGLYHYKKDSADGRLLIWKVTSTLIADNPVFGVGFDSFKAHYMNGQAAYFKNSGSTDEAFLAGNTNYAFNTILQFTAENGIIGLLILSVSAFLLIKTVRKNPSFYFIGIPLLATIFSVIFFGLFSYPAQILPIKVILIISVAFIAGIQEKKLSFGVNLKKWRFLVSGQAWAKVGLILFSIPLIVVVVERTTSLQNGFVQWEKANAIYSYGIYEDSVAEFEKVYPLFKTEGAFLMQYGKALEMSGQYKKALIILMNARKHFNSTIVETALGNTNKAIKDYSKAEGNYQMAACMIPSRFYPSYLLAKLYEDSGQMEKATNKAKDILKKEVKVPSRAIDEIQEEMKRMILHTDKKI